MLGLYTHNDNFFTAILWFLYKTFMTPVATPAILHTAGCVKPALLVLVDRDTFPSSDLRRLSGRWSRPARNWVPGGMAVTRRMMGRHLDSGMFLLR